MMAACTKSNNFVLFSTVFTYIRKDYIIMILSCSHISKSFGIDEIIKDATFHIEEREKAAIVGINGCGKSTLLKMIIGDLSPDSGDISFKADIKIGYLAQKQDLSSGNTIYEEVLSVKQDLLDMERQLRKLELSISEEAANASSDRYNSLLDLYSNLSHEYESKNGYAVKSQVTGIIKGLGFSENDFDLKVDTLSGGQKTRVALCKILVSEPDLLFLDEPINHLDMNSIAWLEGFLREYKGSVVIVAHDRYFLDKIVSKIIEIDQGKVRSFMGNYSDYSKKKAILRNMEMKAYLNNQREIKHQEEVITKLKQFNREKSIKRAESREKRLEHMEIIEKPTEINDTMNISLSPRFESGNDVLTVKGLSKHFDNDPLLFSNLDFEIKKGEHVALIGDNGSGKTTILKIINGICQADSGSIKLGSNVCIGYYDQEHHVLDPDKTLFQELQDSYPDLDNTKIRTTLAAFLFTSDDVFKYIRELSGGEKGRVSLAKLMLSDANLLILDEPTNHLDITSKEILESAINSYEGTVLYVSHDRYFINQTASRILELSGKHLLNYIGNYDYYLEKFDDMHRAIQASNQTSKSGSATNSDSKVNEDASSASSSIDDWKNSKALQAKKKKLSQELKKVEETISSHEERIEAIDTESASDEVCTNLPRLNELHKERTALSDELESLYLRWEELSEELDAL